MSHAWDSLRARREAGDLPWMDLHHRNLDDVLAFGEHAKGRVENMVVLGIGGSALGLTALGTALLHPFHNLLPSAERGGRPRLFVVDNVDPDQMAGLFNHLDLRRSLVNVISKSGTTAETMAAYLLVRRLLEQQVGPGHHAGPPGVHHRPLQRRAAEDRAGGGHPHVRHPPGGGRALLGPQ